MIYLIHLETNLSHARHYLGFTESLDPKSRLEQHRRGEGAKILAECNRQGIKYDIVRTWEGDRYRERQMKNWKKIRLYCPICSPKKKHT